MFVHRGALQSFASGLVQVGRLSPSGPMPGTPAGVALARLVGEPLGTFASVVTSASPRAIETAVARASPCTTLRSCRRGYVPLLNGLLQGTLVA
jgi:broad specificity phosphatase PhoE